LLETLPSILFEDNHCIAINKPAGMPAAHFGGTVETADRAVKRYLKDKYHKPGNVFLGVVHRLDRPVSGVLLFARTTKAAARLSDQFRSASVEKTYWALVEGNPTPSEGRIENWLFHDDHARRVRAASPMDASARHARLRYRTRRAIGDRAWLEVNPETGRKHQIRVQLAGKGWPIVGDHRYGASTPFSSGVALHARALRFEHPVRHEPVVVTAALPVAWHSAFPPGFAEEHA
jgi:23S rRNA pseudouridine1911/1915/1917 synthase